ncbi:MAG TPA: LamG-like jellyroll fold domain-containing protein [Candidatus Sulfotelmatobacter sp.]|nr:LamG-like jellyroll fold domain-containing protein [Candidatus Sulfotelmatobacter sp.]
MNSSINSVAMKFAASATIVCAAFAAGAQVSYNATVLSNNPIAFYEFNDPFGSSAAADSSATGQYPGSYEYSTDGLYPELGQPGIDTNSILLSASDPDPGFVYAYYPQFNGTNAFSIEIWCDPSSDDSVNYHCPIGNFSGWLPPNYGTGAGWYVYQTPGSASSSTFEFVTGDQNVYIPSSGGVIPGHWYYLVITYDGTNFSFYVNGQLVRTQSDPGYLSQTAAGTSNALGIGERGDDSQFFSGYLDDFAYYTNTLTPAQILNDYEVGSNALSALSVPPSIAQNVVSTTAYAGTTAEFSVNAAGTAPLKYQWYEGSSPISGATNDTLSFICTPAENGDTYYVIVSNAIGSVTSSTGTLTVSTAIQIDAPLTSITRNVGSAAAFEIVAEGALPITYQWYNGSSPIAGATNSVLWLSDVQLTNSGANYSVDISNPYTSIDSQPATLTVQPRPVDVPVSPYGALVEADGAVAYWELDETNGSTNAIDAVGSFDGSYTAGSGAFTFGEPTGVPGDTNTAVGITNGATVVVPYAIEINPPGPFTVEGWFQPAAVATAYSTPISSISNPYGAGPTGWLVYQTAGNNWSWWPYNGFYNGIQIYDYDQIVANQWYYLAMVYDGTNFTFYVNDVDEGSLTDSGFAQNGNVPSGGAADYNYNYNTTTGLPTGSSPLTIGWRSDGNFNPFAGAVADVAVYDQALTPQQIQNHYLNEVFLNIKQSGNNAILSWPSAAGTLQESTKLNGPWVNMSGVNPPYTNSDSGTMFFRLLRQ